MLVDAPSRDLRGAAARETPRRAAEAAVRLRGVGKRHGAQWVLRHADLEIHPGETAAVVGESGSGKTTLLQLVNAVLLPDEGEVEVFGAPVPRARLERFRRRIGYAVQGAALFPHLTVFENVVLLARLERWSADAIEARFAELLALLALDPGLASRHPHELSGGQQQRVGLCRALMLRPGLLLLDEPFSAVDPLTRADIHAQFQVLLAHEKLTTLLVTHDMQEALRLAERLVIMRGGSIVQQGLAGEIAAQPGDSYVRRLLQASA